MKKYLKRITPLYKLYLYLFRLKNITYQRLVIPSYEVKRLAIIDLSKKYRYNDVFIETGTFMGDTVAYLKDYFSHLISIELNDDLAEKCKKRFADNNKIQIIRGDSTEQLSLILTSIDTSVVFWLDGHYSSEFWAGDNYIVTAMGEKETPIIE